MSKPTGKPNGRPRKYAKAEEVQRLIDAYFADCEKNKRPLTVTGLADALDMDRHQLLDYGSKEEFHHAISRAKRKIHIWTESTLYSESFKGAQFSLKNNFGWKDKTEVEHSGEMTLTTALQMAQNRRKSGTNGTD